MLGVLWTGAKVGRALGAAAISEYDVTAIPGEGKCNDTSKSA
jgi:hypothetical protein